MLVVVVTCEACVRPAPRLASPAALPGPPVLAVVTWNLHAGAGDLPRFIGDLRAGRVTGGAPVGAFVLLLQEAIARPGPPDAPNDVLRIARELRLSAYFVPARRSGELERGTALLSTFPLLNAHAVELRRERQRRFAAVASVVVGGQRLLVTNVHLENRASWWHALFAEGARERQMHALLEVLPDRDPGVLGGDFNTWLGVREPAYRAARKRFPDVPDGPPLITFGDRLALDHLFFRLPQGWKAVQLRAAMRYGSDHHPVIALLFVGNN